jgi:hypothetical protein
MTRLMISFAATAAMAGGFALLPSPAAAQSAQAEVIVYGNDPCPRSTESEIVVCSRRPESERYRLPKNQQLQGSRQQRLSWARQSEALTTVGNTGSGCCSAVGPGGHTGCLIQEINRAKQESQEQSQANQAPEQ